MAYNDEMNLREHLYTSSLLLPFSSVQSVQVDWSKINKHNFTFQKLKEATEKMTNYKLIYFDLTGLGEPIRFMLSYGGVKFEDKRINSEEWKELKPQIPMGQLPVLEIDGKKYYQSKAIGRFLAKKFDLYGSDEFEAMEIDAVVDTIDDLRQALVSYTFEEDPDVKAKLKEKNSPKVPLFLEKLESLVERNGGYFVGGKLSWPDIVFAAHSKFASHMLEGDVSKDHPELKKLTDKVLAIPNIKKYVDGRPDTRV